MLKNRVSGLEEELGKVREEKTDQVFEIRKLSLAKEKLENELHKMKSENVQAQGSSQTSGATISRLQG